MRYASGGPVSILVQGGADALAVEVDNDPATNTGRPVGEGTGNGLTGLRERVGACGGTLDAGPRPDGGWRLSARIPRRTPALPHPRG